MMLSGSVNSLRFNALHLWPGAKPHAAQAKRMAAMGMFCAVRAQSITQITPCRRENARGAAAYQYGSSRVRTVYCGIVLSVNCLTLRRVSSACIASIPAVNQVECNPFCQQRELLAEEVKIEACYPLGHGNAELLGNPTVAALDAKYSKNAGQILLRFETQDGLIVLPKSTKPERIRGNIDIFDFTLTDAEMQQMRALDTGKTSHDPEAPGVGEMLLNAFVVED